MQNVAFFTYGGWTRNGRCTDGLFVLHLQSSTRATWSSLKLNGIDLGAVSSFCMTALGGSIYICGGQPHHNEKVTCIDLKTLTVSRVIENAQESLVYGQTAVRSGGSILLFGKDENLLHYQRVCMDRDSSA